MPWPLDGLEFFAPSEFDYPEKMDAELLLILDEVRRRSGVALEVTSDWRSQADTVRLYPDPAKRPNSPHPRGTAVDFKPVDNTPANRLTVLGVILDMYREGEIPRMGLEVATKHFHLDIDHELSRPHFWVGVSK